MYFLIAISWLIIITFLHFIPGPDLPQSYWSIIFQIDKIVHAFIFCVGVYLFAIALSQKQKKFFNFINFTFYSIRFDVRISSGIIFCI